MLITAASFFLALKNPMLPNTNLKHCSKDSFASALHIKTVTPIFHSFTSYFFSLVLKNKVLVFIFKAYNAVPTFYHSTNSNDLSINTELVYPKLYKIYSVSELYPLQADVEFTFASWFLRWNISTCIFDGFIDR